MKTLHKLLLAAGLAAGLAFGGSETSAAAPMMAPGALATNGGVNIEKTVVVAHRRAVRRPVAVRRRVVR